MSNDSTSTDRTSTGQRYAPPLASVEDVVDASGGYQPIRLWPAKGRIGRLRFIAYTMGFYVAFVGVTFVLALVAGIAGVDPSLVTTLALLPYLFGLALLVVARSHDMNVSGWWSLLAIVPFVGLYWVVKAGTPGANRWGAPPPPNSTVVKVAAFAAIGLTVLGIVIAVGIAAYFGSAFFPAASPR